MHFFSYSSCTITLDGGAVALYQTFAFHFRSFKTVGIEKATRSSYKRYLCPRWFEKRQQTLVKHFSDINEALKVVKRL